MTHPLSRRVALGLGLILLLGTAARVPGLFWGYNFFGTEVVTLNPNEPYYSLYGSPTAGYPRGLETHVRLLTRLLEAVGLANVVQWAHYGFFAGRLVSLIYGIFTLVVLFRLTRSFFKDDGIGLLAAFFLALADLHVTYSHIGTPDAPATFWFYAALASAHAALERGSRRAVLFSAVSTGATAAMRFQLMSLIPLVWWVARSRRRPLSGLLLLMTVSVSFLLFNGLAFDPSATLWLLTNLAFRGDPEWKKLFLPLVYLAVLFVGVGLPVFLLAGYGLVRFARAKWATLRGWRDLLTDNQIPICLAAVAALLQMSAVALWAHYHAVVLIPFVAMLAAYGFSQLPRRAWGPWSAGAAARGLLALIAVYLGVQVASVQAHFVEDPLEGAGRWLRARVPPGETVSTFVAAVPPEYPTIAEWKANYLILSARGYRRYLFRDFLPSRLTGRVVTPDDVAARRVHGTSVGDLQRLHKLFGGELPYRLVKAIRLRFYTPELLLANAVWYPPPHLDEVLIYERRRERERTVALLTPSRTDYLVTLHPGKLWRLEPGQQVRLTVDGEPLAVQLGEGTTHFVLPRALVSSPYSQLRLSSDRLLPHLPLDFVRRVRPVGQEFAVESLLDGDLLPGGFSEPEIRADGATWRWTTGAGQILLPGPGSSGPWRRLAARVAGHPASRRAQPVALFLDGRKLGDAQVLAVARTLEFPLPPRAFDGEIGRLEIIAPTSAEVAGAGETRRVGVAVYWVRLTRAERFQPSGQPVAGVSLPRAWRPLFGLGLPYRVQAVSFPSGGLTLRGDLFIPAGGGRSAILLAHGAGVLGRKHGLYLGLARRLAEKGYWVLLTDFRGYGESERPSRILSPRDLDFTQDLAAGLGYLERRLGARGVVVVGHSFGADVGIALAARDPRVRKLVAISPARRVYQRFLESPGGLQILRDRMAAEMGLGPAQIPVELVESIVAPITIDNYVEHRFRPPILLVDGELEDEADLRFLRDIYRRLKATKAYVTIPNADHYFGVLREVEERDPVTLGALADVADGWIREGTRWSRSAE